MTKYCARCGKALPEGVEICPICGPDIREDDAALFTRMTTETEVWKNPEPVKQRKVRVRRPQGRRIGLLAAVIGVAAVAAVVLILLSQPAARVVRAIRSGDYEKAYAIYWNSSSLRSGERNEKVDAEIMKAARLLCDSFANHEIEADDAASKLSLLGGFGEGAAEMLEETYAEFRSYNGSQEQMQTADASFDAGEYLEARKEYLAVLDTDADYERAQARAAECLVRYGEKVAAEADDLMEENDFRGALDVLQDGNATLYQFDTFSEVIDLKRQECYDRYEQYVLDWAAALADLEDYDAALSSIRAAVPDIPGEVKSFTEAIERYSELATAKHVSDAGVRADNLYELGEYAAAFSELEDIRDAAPENEAGAEALLDAMEARFTADMCGKAKDCFGGVRDNLPDAIAILDDALAERELEDIRAYRDELSSYLPLQLVEAEYFAKSGTVFRSDTVFESLDGTRYGGGWIWGENGAEIRFAVDGAYDEFYCAFAVRRDDDKETSGSFELWGDGELLLESGTLSHSQKDPMYFRTDISGYNELKLVFLCDYEVSTAADGYCYHALCDACLTKDIPKT